jgi:hypothetical protein
METMQDSDLALVYAKPGVDLHRYDRIILEPATVSFRKDWRRSQNRGPARKVTDKDMSRIVSDLSDLFDDVFTQELTKGGYELASGPGENVLRVRPAIVNLDIVAPDVDSPHRVDQYSGSGGEMTLYLELYDSQTGDLIARALDRKRDPELHHYFEWRSRVSNLAMARRMMRSWASTLRAGLDQARMVDST